MKFFFTTFMFSLIAHASRAEVEVKKSNLRALAGGSRKLDQVAPQWEPRIVGGQDAGVGEYPFFVQGSGCGASLIWKDIVLTAAHCAGYIKNGDNQVLVGARNSNSLVSQ